MTPWTDPILVQAVARALLDTHGGPVEPRSLLGQAQEICEAAEAHGRSIAEEATQTLLAAALAVVTMRLGSPLILWWANPNGGKRSAREAGRLKAAGARAGVPDLTLFRHDGAMLWLEIKRAKGGQVSPAQRSVIGVLALLPGHRARVARGLCEAVCVVRCWLQSAEV